MYQVENAGQALRSRGYLRALRVMAPKVSRIVVMLGLTSLFTDISSEMVSTILPLYLLFHLNLTPAVFGVVDGLYQGAAALVRIFGGAAADRRGHHKEVALTGYALSAIARLGLLVVGNVWTLLAGIVMVDRLGKGIRTAPRDALISLSTPTEDLGVAFGVHRALDTAGAMIGPLLAFGLLAIAPGAYDAVFVVSLCAALIGLGVLIFFVHNPPIASADLTERRLTFAAAARLLRVPGLAPLLLAGTVLSLVTMSDAFVYLTLQRQVRFEPKFFPLLYVATATIFMLMAVPVGRLADRWGRARVFLGGYALLLVVYASLLVPGASTLRVILALALLGTYYAATDGVLMALAGAALPPEVRASGMALVTTGTSLARLAASVLFGALWTWQGVPVAVTLSLIGLVAALLLSVFWLRTGRDGGSHVAPTS
ncbi:MAG TPA: MFS transporter [Gemmatimonadales bacterium]|nr:MFS transporter [Gemmatimonadales bacterium]